VEKEGKPGVGFPSFSGSEQECEDVQAGGVFTGRAVSVHSAN
jgi:hypothetical protein